MKTINKVFLILLVSLLSSPLFAQSDLSFGYRTPKVEINTFVKEVEGSGSLVATVQAADGGYVTTSKIDDLSVLVRKIKASGQKQWERRLNFEGDAAIAINGITQTTDGGFVLAGQVCLDQSCGATLVKLRANGTVAWKKSLAVSGVFDPGFSSVIATPDGGVIAVGDGLFGDCEIGCGGFLFVARITATGDVVWGKSFGSLSVFFYGINSTATPDNGFIVAFQTSNRPNRLLVMKITNSGKVVWKKSLTADGFGFGGFQSLGTTADNGVILVRTTGSNKLKVVVLKADGTLNWNAGYSLKVPGGIQSVSSPVRTPDGGYVLTGTTRSGSGFVTKIDSSRNVAFQNTFAASGESVFTTPDGGFFLFGDVTEGIVVSKLNSEGIVPDCDFFGSPGATTRTSFGPLGIAGATTTASDLSLEPFDFGLTSVVTNHPQTPVCQ